jgi:adenosylcobalamin-dependent ribonucleoside-diphosphate reductase
MMIAPVTAIAAAPSFIDRRYTKPGVDPLSEVQWDTRSAKIVDSNGTVVFQAENVEVPANFSQLATDIAVSKYFRKAGLYGDKKKGETSFRQVVTRIAKSIRKAGEEYGYFKGDEADAFEAELTYMLVHQIGAFNSPVWFNCGLWQQYGIKNQGGTWAYNLQRQGDDAEVVQLDNSYERPQCSACFIQSVDDDLMSIFDTVKNEARLFKYGSGTGSNFSKIRSRYEKLSGGGYSSGLMGFLEVFDRAAGAIKSGGTCLAPYQRVYTATGPVPVKELAERKSFVALSYDPPAGRYKAKKARAWLAGEKAVVRITTDKGAFDVTDDHPVKLSTGEFVHAGKLVEGMSLFACSIDLQHGHLRVHLRDGRKGKEFLHRLVASDVMNLDIEGVSVHHKDEDRYNNEPWNLEPKLQADHVRDHNMDRVSEGTHIFQLQTFPKSGEANGMHKDSPFWKDAQKVEAYRVKQAEILAESGRAEIMQQYAAEQKMLNTAFQVLNAGHSIDTFESYVEGRKQVVGRIGSISKLRQQIIDRFGSYNDFVHAVSASNHRVLRVEQIGTMPVYDIEVTCPTSDDKSPQTGHNFVIWPSDNRTGSGVVVANTRRAAKMVCLDMDHPEIVDFIEWKVQEEKKAQALIAAGFSADFNGEAYRTISGQNSNNSVRVTDEFMQAVRHDGNWNTTTRTTKKVVQTHKARELWNKIAEAAWQCADPGVQYDTTINKWHTVPNSGRINGSNPCSEYMHLDDTACNLASLNLTKFLRDNGTFDIEAYHHAIRIFFIAQEILVDFSSYPTSTIAKNSHDFRPLGLGYANLGAMLMQVGIPYDSDEGRYVCSCLTAMLTGYAYRVSAEMAERKGPFAAFTINRDAMLNVMRMHKEAAQAIPSHKGAMADPLANLREAAVTDWKEAVIFGERYGYRNAQATVLAPTGTIGLLMDCDTTGIEPDFALVKYKKLAGGGNVKIVNQSVGRALKKLGYSSQDVADALEYIKEHDTIEGWTKLKDSVFLSVFDCASRCGKKGTRMLAPMAHLKMMAAAQPFLSGAISKCLVGETIVPTSAGLLRLGSLYNGQQKPDSFRELSIDVASRAGTETASAFYYNGRQQTVLVSLADGRVEHGTPQHRVLVAEGTGLQWKTLAELQPGDWVASKLGTEMWGSDKRIEFTPSPYYGSQHKETVFPTKMSPQLGLLLGMLTADGHITEANYTVGLTKGDDAVLSTFAALIKELFNLDATPSSDPRSNAKFMAIHSKHVVEFLHSIGFSKSHIPDCILAASRDTVLAYMSGLYLDGWVAQSICISQKAISLTRDLQQVWANLGVHTYFTDNVVDDVNYRVLQVSGGYRKRAAELLHFLEPHKAERARALDNGENRDVFPFSAVRAQLGDRLRETHRTQQFRNILDPRTQYVRMTTMADPELRPMLDVSDEVFGYVYTQVASVEDGGTRHVFDLSVPGSHSYVANGVVSHNTVNLPNEATVDDVRELYEAGWTLGLKAVAIYRDGCKASQPLNTSDDKKTDKAPTEMQTHRPHGRRVRLPKRRSGWTQESRVGGAKIFLRTGEYEDGTLGEIFIDMHKEGSTFRSLLGCLAMSVSLGLQYGVPLSAYVKQFTFTRFEPAGPVEGHPHIRMASSIVDYIFRTLGIEYLGRDDLAHIKPPKNVIRDPSEQDRDEPTSANMKVAPVAAIEPPQMGAGDVAYAEMQRDAPPCDQCGHLTVRNGTCYRCLNCGNSMGCS